MNAGTSLYLDLARISAATMVLLHHVFAPPFYEGVLHFPGRSAVITFFVISGFVIAYANEGVSDWRVYAVARFARIYSVALPALLLTGVLYALGRLLSSEMVAAFNHPFARLAASALFLNQIWNLTIAALTNGPYWSLCYEVWYYVLFGVACFAPARQRWMLLLAVCLLVGPRILLLMPIWLIGLWAYHASRHATRLPRVAETALFWLFLILFLGAISGFNPADGISELIARELENGFIRFGPISVFVGSDWRFPSDYVMALLFAGSVYFSRSAVRERVVVHPAASAVRVSASYTFSLYLYHAPLLLFLHPALALALPATVVPWATVALILAIVVLLGRQTEHRKQPYSAIARRLLGTTTARPGPYESRVKQ